MVNPYLFIPLHRLLCCPPMLPPSRELENPPSREVPLGNGFRTAASTEPRPDTTSTLPSQFTVPLQQAGPSVQATAIIRERKCALGQQADRAVMEADPDVLQHLAMAAQCRLGALARTLQTLSTPTTLLATSRQPGCRHCSPLPRGSLLFSWESVRQTVCTPTTRGRTATSQCRGPHRSALCGGTLAF